LQPWRGIDVRFNPKSDRINYRWHGREVPFSTTVHRGNVWVEQVSATKIPLSNPQREKKARKTFRA
jgi:hypothetical protein